jgi:hypothetical protein
MRLVSIAVGVAFAFTSAVSFAQSTPAASGTDAVAKPVPAQPADPPANGGHYNSQSTPMGTLLGDSDAKAVLAKYIPDIVNNPGISQAASMTLKMLQQYAPDMLSDKVLSEIDAELSKLSLKN